jgi:hypothetical protein
MYLSDVFKFTQGLGQKGHQIGRKVGDAIELLTLGMINLHPELTKYLVIEDGVEGATSAKHKVEFSFYKLDANENPSRISEELFGIIECKKVGVEQTIKQSFKQWQSIADNKKDFYLTDGYEFTISPSATDFKWSIIIKGNDTAEGNIKVTIIKIEDGTILETETKYFKCILDQQLLIAVNLQKLSQIEGSIHKCIIVEVKHLNGINITKINVNESLPGPQTPEKAKQASFVSLDVRKKVLGQFDKSENKSFISILVIGEASHWEEKSRSMVRLCNDYNLVVPDKILVYLFSKFLESFGDHYQDKITKTSYRDSADVRDLIANIILHFEKTVLSEMETGDFMQFKYENIENHNRLIIAPIA